MPRKKKDERYKQMFLEMIDHVIHCEFKEGFALSDISWEKRISELEFDLSVDQFNIDAYILNTKTINKTLLEVIDPELT